MPDLPAKVMYKSMDEFVKYLQKLFINPLIKAVPKLKLKR